MVKKNPGTPRSPGQAFRDKVTKTFDVEDSGPAWAEQLEVAASTIDLVAELEALIRDEGLMQDGLHQRVIHPAVRELRAQRLALTRMLAALGLSEDGETQSDRQRRNAQKRWGKP